MQPITICDRCGEELTFPYRHDGKRYGSTCFQIVTGAPAPKRTKGIWLAYAVTPNADGNNPRRFSMGAIADYANAVAMLPRGAVLVPFVVSHVGYPSFLTVEEIAPYLTKGDDQCATTR